jgi:hypothetical protein
MMMLAACLLAFPKEVWVHVKTSQPDLNAVAMED